VQAYENKYTGKFKWLSDPEGSYTWGYRAQALCEHQPGFGGAEGIGPIDADIGEDYEQQTDTDGKLVFEDVIKIRERQMIYKHLLTKKIKKCSHISQTWLI